MNNLDFLKSKPLLAAVESLLDAYILDDVQHAQSYTLQLSTNLINYTIPEIYNTAPQIRRKITRALTSVIGIGNLISKLQMVKQDQQMVKLYATVLLEIYSDDMCTLLVKGPPTPLVLKEIDKLVFKGRAFAVVNELGITLRPFDDYEHYMSSQLLSLFKQDTDIKTLQRFAHSTLSMSDRSNWYFFSSFFTSLEVPYFKMVLMHSSKAERKRMTSMLFKFLDKPLRNCETNEISAYFKVLGDMELYIDCSLVDLTIKYLNFSLNKLLGLLTPTQLIPQLLSQWSDEQLIKTESIVVQESRTQFLLNLLLQKDPSVAEGLLSNADFLAGISNRMQSISEAPRNLGIVFANHVCKLAQKDEIFKVDLNYSKLIGSKIDTFQTSLEWDVINSSLNFTKPLTQILLIHPEKNTETTTLAQKVDKISLKIDSDDDSDDDDQTSQEETLPVPIYIKQLLEYLNYDEKNPRAHDTKMLALRHGSSLIRQKFQNEVSFFANDLLTTLVGMTTDDQYQNELRVQMMISVVVRYPDGVVHLCDLLQTGDYSLQQRMVILSTISIAARELRGFDDQVVSFEKRAFPSKKLPENLHKYYLEEPTKEIQNEMMHTIQLDQGTIVRKSTRILKASDKKPYASDFFKIVSQKFFFPLVHVWYHSDGPKLDIGHYTSVFIGHYISTLNLVFHASYPATRALPDMIREHLIILTSALRGASLEHTQLLESIVTGVMIATEITDQYNEYAEPLIFVQNWLNHNWSTIIDDKLKSLCAGLLLRLTDIDNSLINTIYQP